MANECMKIYSVSVVIRNMQIKATRYYITATRMATRKNVIASFSEDIEKMNPYTSFNSKIQ